MGKPVSEVSATGPFKFTYFGVEGAGEKVRLAFVLSGIPFEDVAVDRATWAEEKKTMKYGQVPKLQVGDAELFQSMAMMKYIALASDSKSLYPVADPLKCVEIDEMLELCQDFQKAWTPCNYIGSRPHLYGYPADMSKDDKDALGKGKRQL